jgi:secreted trypsin-like serine protease
MNLCLAFLVFYLAFHSVNGQEATSLRGRSLQDAQAPGAASDGGNAIQEQNQASTRIIDGSDAIEDVEDRFSYVVSLQYFGQHMCGGSLIEKDVVLTAAHCDHQDTVVLGRHNLNDSNGEALSIWGKLPHPEYNGDTKENDYKLIFLEGTPTADNAVLVRLNSDPLVLSLGQDIMTVMGWGDTDPRSRRSRDR